MPRTARDVVFVDGVRTPFGKAGPKGMYAETRADDLIIKCTGSSVRRHPELPLERIGEVAIAATTQIGDQGLTLGRTAGLLAGLPQVGAGLLDRPDVRGRDDGRDQRGRADRAGARWTSPSRAASSTWGGTRWARAWTRTRGSSPSGLVDESALVMGQTAENLHDRFPQLTKERADAYAAASQEKYAKALANGKIQPDLVAGRDEEHPRVAGRSRLGTRDR